MKNPSETTLSELDYRNNSIFDCHQDLAHILGSSTDAFIALDDAMVVTYFNAATAQQ